MHIFLNANETVHRSRSLDTESLVEQNYDCDEFK